MHAFLIRGLHLTQCSLTAKVVTSSSLVAQSGILFISLWHSDHLGHGHGVDLAESLRGDHVSRYVHISIHKFHVSNHWRQHQPATSKYSK